MSALRTRQVEVRGVRSPVLEGGPQGRDEAVVFLHGNPGTGRDFEDLLTRAAEFARVLAPDMPGFGRADRPRAFDYSVPGYAAHLGGLLEELGVSRAHLVLHDFGGPWGLEWAAEHPHALGSLVLLNTGALIRYRWHFLARIWRTPVLGELFQLTTTRFAFKSLVNRLNPRPLPDAFLDRMYDEADRGTDRAVRRLYRATDHPDRMGARHAAALRELRPPALVVWGTGDPYLKTALGERQREALPDMRFVPVEDAGHWVFADQPERVAAEVVPFLRAHVGG